MVYRPLPGKVSVSLDRSPVGVVYGRVGRTGDSNVHLVHLVFRSLVTDVKVSPLSHTFTTADAQRCQ